MFLEICQMDIKPGLEAEFEAAVAKAVPFFQRAAGCRGMELRGSIERPGRYRFMVKWEHVDDHLATFRNSADFQALRGLIGHLIDGAPAVEHTVEKVSGF
ncbi:antibiotic biosynthesis monooxygenase [Caballeronia sp. LjRoot34]|uniref:antibiotic biosynthesis monooxygenase family protein n=1 Tax=Caballeronia sp. LjRoot34 TaxID=3342325 RepID=UPI003ECC7D8A